MADLPKSKVIKPRDVEPDKAGKVADAIGSGKFAQDSIIYFVIAWTFIYAGVLSLFLLISGWRTGNYPTVQDYMEIWKSVVPVLTAALGYLFGKRS